MKNCRENNREIGTRMETIIIKYIQIYIKDSYKFLTLFTIFFFLTNLAALLVNIIVEDSGQHHRPKLRATKQPSLLAYNHGEHQWSTQQPISETKDTTKNTRRKGF